MAQLSLPYRIALVALLVVCALWFTVLRPKDPAVEPPPPAAPGTTGLANDVSAAKGAAAVSDASKATTQAATGGAQAPAATAAAGRKATTATAANAKPAAAAKAAKASATRGAGAGADPSAPLLRALDHDRAVVLLFWNKRGTDDRAARRAVTATALRHGRVVVKAAPLAEVGRYEAITRGVQVLESPTVLVIGPGHTAKPIVGLTTTGEIDQAVGDALAAAKPGK